MESLHTYEPLIGRSKVRAAFLERAREPLAFVELGVPPLRMGQVLVRIAYSGVCHSQVMETQGLRGPDAWLPHMLGHEGSGVVEAIGENVTKVRVGDRVILTWIRCSGIDAGGSTFESSIGPINAGPVTTFSDFSIISENRLVLLPDDVPMDLAVLFGCALPTGGGIVLNELKPTGGETLAIHGLGGIGLCALLVAAASARFSRIIAIDVMDDKLQLALELGATDAINAESVLSPAAEIFELTDGRGVDFAIDASGKGTVIAGAFDAVRRQGGLCVFASHPPAGTRISLDPFEMINGKQIRGSWGGACEPDRDVPLFAEMYRAGKLPLEKLVSTRYRLEQINDALADLAAGRSLRPLIEIDSTIS